MKFEYTTGKLSAMENTKIALAIFPEAAHIKGMGVFKVTDGRIIVTYRRIIHVTRKHISPLEKYINS